MLTTAFGMVISIPSLLCYRTFKRIIEKRILAMSLYEEGER
jgi:biopolymer transport protein ExbB/TolQ